MQKVTERLAQLSEYERWQLLLKLAQAQPDQVLDHLIGDIERNRRERYYPGYTLHKAQASAA